MTGKQEEYGRKTKRKKMYSFRIKRIMVNWRKGYGVVESRDYVAKKLPSSKLLAKREKIILFSVYDI